MAQKLVSVEVPRRVLYRVEEAVVLLGLSAASCTNSSDRAGCRL
jgi:hypothetical protein